MSIDVDSTTYTLKQGRYLTIEGVARDESGNLVDISTGYIFVATVKTDPSVTDANADIHISSDVDTTRFVEVDNNTIRIYLVTSAESNQLTPGRYYYDAWAAETSGGLQETPIASGRLNIEDAVTDTKQ